MSVPMFQAMVRDGSPQSPGLPLVQCHSTRGSRDEFRKSEKHPLNKCQFWWCRDISMWEKQKSNWKGRHVLRVCALFEYPSLPSITFIKPGVPQYTLQLPPNIWLQHNKKKLWNIMNRRSSLRALCTSIQKEQQELSEEDASVFCGPCNGRGWVLCDFCKGMKNNVKSENNRIYRRCPSCKAVGYILCSKCKVYKCVTFPDYGDGNL